MVLFVTVHRCTTISEVSRETVHGSLRMLVPRGRYDYIERTGGSVSVEFVDLNR